MGYLGASSKTRVIAALTTAQTQSRQAVADLDRYAPNIQEEKRVEAAGIVEAARTAATEEVNEWQAEALNLRTVSNLDPVMELSTSEIERVNALRPFVREACESLPLPDLAARLRAEAAHGDTASRFVHARYAGERLAAWRAAATSNQPGGSAAAREQGASELTAALAELEKTVALPKRAAATARADEIVAAVREVQGLVRQLSTARVSTMPGQRL